jgi:hypothetical protein
MNSHNAFAVWDFTPAGKKIRSSALFYSHPCTVWTIPRYPVLRSRDKMQLATHELAEGRVRCNERLDRLHRREKRWMGRQEHDARVNGRTKSYGPQCKATGNLRKNLPKCVEDERKVEECGGD